MKSWLLFVAGAVLALAAPNGGLKEVHNVYLLPMSGGLDQLLAERLTTGAVFQVVTDPMKADTVFTERIGASFEEALTELYDTKSKDQKEKDSSYTRPTMKPLGRGKGSVFLVDRKTRAVIWSSYEKPSGRASDPHSLAVRIVAKIEKDLKAK